MLRKEKEGSFPASPSFWVWLGLGFMVPGIDWEGALTDPRSVLLGACAPAP